MKTGCCRLFCTLMALHLLAGWAMAGTITYAPPRLALDGKSVPLSESMHWAWTGADTIGWVQVTEDATDQPIKAGMYFFKHPDTYVGYAPMDEPCVKVMVSPDMKAIAIDQGTSDARGLSFYTWPGLKPLGRSVAYNNPDSVAWAADGSVFYTTFAEDRAAQLGRPCGAEVCGPTSVHRYFPARNEDRVVMAGTALCDAQIQSVRQSEDGKRVTLVIQKICRKHVRDWADMRVGRPQQTTLLHKTIVLKK